MSNFAFVFLLFAAMTVPFSALAQSLTERHLPMDGTIAQDGKSVTLNWFDAERDRRGAVTINRRQLGETGADSWQSLAPALGTVMQFTDDTTRSGVAYEYQILRHGRSLVDVGYWVTGVDIPAEDQRGYVHLVIDETLTDDMSAHLRRFQNDLIGDGWRVQVAEAPRRDPLDQIANLQNALAIKTWLLDRFSRRPGAKHAVILIGNIPVILSGRANPDGHDPQPQATDLFYADLNGKWRITQEGFVLENQVPTDHIEVQVGRIDFWNLSRNDPDHERHLLRSYFDKNHHWRMGLHGELNTAYGKPGELDGELLALRNIVGPDAVEIGGHHDIGEEKPWLWGVDFGDWNGRSYAENYANKAVFAINFGSGKQQIGGLDNGMNALLGLPWYPIAVGWGARPTWWLHHMSLGGTIGDVHFRTVNNGHADQPYPEGLEYFPTGRYPWQNPVWVNLLGDPTARAHILLPPLGVRVKATEKGNVISWTASPDPDVSRYRIYANTPGQSDFLPIGESTGGDNNMFLDIVARSDVTYMVRAYGKKRVYAGSFYALSQGVFAGLNDQVPTVEDIAITTAPNTAVFLPRAFDAPTGNVIHGLIAGPSSGDLAFEEGRWKYTPAEGFLGEIVLEFAVSDGAQTKTGVLTILVGP